MSELVEVKTCEMVGPALDWAVAESEDLRPYHHNGEFWVLDGKTNALLPKFSTDWAIGGPLIDHYKIWISPPSLDRNEWSSAHGNSTRDSLGHTAMISACRAIVAAKLGDVVQVPKELIND